MTMDENKRLILGLRELGLNGDQVTNFLLWIESGEDQYKPQPLKQDT